MVTCDFFLEGNPDAVYTVGEVIKGYAELVAEEPESIRSLKLSIIGVAYVCLGQVEGNRIEVTENYINHEEVVFGTSSGPSIELAAGSHRYSFELQLPSDIPPSFEYNTRFGLVEVYIRYHVELRMDKKFMIDKNFKKPFKVQSDGNLNHFPDLTIPRSIEGSKQFGCIFCSSLPLSMEVWIPHAGFVAGQNIPLKIKYDNKSSQTIHKTKVILRKIFKSNTNYKIGLLNSKAEVTNDKIASSTGDGVGRTTDSLVYMNLQIPEGIETSNDVHCKIIAISYQLEVLASGPIWSKDLKVTIPITIGTIPVVTEGNSRTLF